MRITEDARRRRRRSTGGAHASEKTLKTNSAGIFVVIETICGLGSFLAEGSVLVAVAIKASHWSERNATSSPGGPVGEARAC